MCKACQRDGPFGTTHQTAGQAVMTLNLADVADTTYKNYKISEDDLKAMIDGAVNMPFGWTNKGYELVAE